MPQYRTQTDLNFRCKKSISHCVSAAANSSCSSDFPCPSSDITVNGNSNSSNSLTPGLDIVNSINAIELITWWGFVNAMSINIKNINVRQMSEFSFTLKLFYGLCNGTK